MLGTAWRFFSSLLPQQQGVPSTDEVSQQPANLNPQGWLLLFQNHIDPNLKKTNFSVMATAVV